MIDTKQAGEKLGDISARRVRALCNEGRIPGAVKHGRDWMLPDNPTVLPATRTRPGKVTRRAR